MNERAAFSNQKHKQELAGLNSIQICHFSQAVFVELKFYRRRTGWRERLKKAAQMLFFAAKAWKGGERGWEEEEEALFCIFLVKSKFKLQNHFKK